MHSNRTLDHKTGRPTLEELNALDSRTLWRIAIVMSLTVGVAASAPVTLFAALVSQCMLFAACGSVIAAALLRHPFVGAPLLTHWDEASFYMLCSMAAGWFVNHEAVGELIRTAAQTTSGVS